MSIWSSEIKELEKLCESLKGQLPDLGKELTQLIHTEDANVILLYSRRCLEVIITDLCECELKRDRGTEPLKGIIDKMNKEKKIPSHIITSMHGLNDLSTYGTHPKDFDPEQVKPVLNNLAIIIRWYLKNKEAGEDINVKPAEAVRQKNISPEEAKRSIQIPKKRSKSLVSGLILLIVVMVSVVLFNNVKSGSKQTNEINKSIAVLPFKLLSNEPDNQYLADGMMDAIVLHLSKIKSLRVISRTSVEQYRNTIKTIPIIGQELDVEYLLEGSFQKSGVDVKLIVQLIKTKKENHIWSEEYNRNWNDIFLVQSEVAQKIAKELNTIITPHEKQLIEKLPTGNLNAYDAYLKGNYFVFGLSHTIINPDSAMKYFELAKELDPGFAPAYAGISYVWRYRIDFGFVSITEGSIKAIESIRKALELDSINAEVQLSYGTVLVETLWDWEKGELAYRKAIELNPNLAVARAFLSLLLSQLGRNEEALKLSKEAIKLDPNNPYVINSYAVDLFFARKYNDALKTIEEILVLDSAFSPTLWYKPYVLHMLGRYEEAFKAYKDFLVNHYLKDYNHAFDEGHSKGGYTMGLIMEADILVAQINLRKAQHFILSDIAVLYTLGGDNEKGLTYLESAYRDHDPLIGYLLMPIFDSLRNYARFQDLCLKMKLPIKPNM